MGDAGERQRPGEVESGTSHVATFAVAVALLAVAFGGATTAGVLGTVGPYLLGVSVLVAALFVVGRW